MTEFHYEEIERQIVDTLPEIRPAAEFYWMTEGEPGQDCGAYIFVEDLVSPYVEVLLCLPASGRRDELLKRAFGLLEQMIASADYRVSELATIGMFEGTDPGWLKRSRPFVGRGARNWLRTYHPSWHDCGFADDTVVPDVLDGYHVRTVIAGELQRAGVSVNQIPGTTYATSGLPNPPLQPTSGAKTGIE